MSCVCLKMSDVHLYKQKLLSMARGMSRNRTVLGGVWGRGSFRGKKEGEEGAEKGRMRTGGGENR